MSFLSVRLLYHQVIEAFPLMGQYRCNSKLDRQLDLTRTIAQFNCTSHMMPVIAINTEVLPAPDRKLLVEPDPDA